MTSTIDTGPAGRDQAAGAQEAPRPLWRNLQFQLLWTGQTAATLGTSVADIAYPLAILALTGSPAQAGLFGAVQAAAGVAAGLPGGHLADRFDARRIVVAAEAGRAAVTAGVVLALVLGQFSLPVLLAAAALLGVGQSIAAAARYLLLRSAVPPAQLTRALAQDEVRMNGAQLAGPALGGSLYAVRALAHAVPFLFTAVSFALSLLAALLVRISPQEPAPGAGQPAEKAGPAAGAAELGQPAENAGAAELGQSAENAGAAELGQPEDNAGPADPGQPGEKAGAAGLGAPERTGMFAGIAALWSHPVLRAATALIMIVNTIGAGLDLVIVVILRGQGTPPAMIGLTLGAGAVGGLAGAPLVPVLHRIRPGVLLLAVCLLLIPVLALLAVPAGPWWAAALLFVSMLGVPSIRVVLDVLVFRQAPPSQRGRVIAAVLTLIGLGAPAGLAATGLLLQLLPAAAAMLILAGALAVGVLCCAARPVLWQARWPS